MHATLAIPNSPWFLGTEVYEPIVRFTSGSAGLVAMNRSNALRLTLGTL